MLTHSNVCGQNSLMRSVFRKLYGIACHPMRICLSILAGLTAFCWRSLELVFKPSRLYTIRVAKFLYGMIERSHTPFALHQNKALELNWNKRNRAVVPLRMASPLSLARQQETLAKGGWVMLRACIHQSQHYAQYHKKKEPTNIIVHIDSKNNTI